MSDQERTNEKKTSDKPTKVKSFSLNEILEEESEISQSEIKQKDSYEEFQKAKTVDVTEEKMKFNLSETIPEELVNSEKGWSSKEEIIVDITNTESGNTESSFKEENTKEIIGSEDIRNPESEGKVSFDEDNSGKVGNREDIKTDAEGKFKASQIDELKETAEFEQNSIKYQKLQINLINASTLYEKVFGILLYNLKKRNGLLFTNAIIVCALRKLQKLNVSDLSEEILASLQEYLDHRSQVSRMKTTDLANILDYLIKVSITSIFLFS